MKREIGDDVHFIVYFNWLIYTQKYIVYIGEKTKNPGKDTRRKRRHGIDKREMTRKR